jgi:hypothetical protein
MASTLNVTTTLVTDHYLITASLALGGTLPREVFIYENTGDGTLGNFYGTCNVQELGRLAIFTLGTPQPTFGNKYLRHWEAKIKVPLDQDPVPVVDTLLLHVKLLSTAYAAQQGTSASYIIP